MRERIGRLRLPLIAAALALACLGCLWRVHALKDLLPSQHAAERWQGERELDFTQLSFFMTRDHKLTREQLYSFRTEMVKKLKEASLDPEADRGLLHDAWSGLDTVKVQNGRRSGEVQVVPVGGWFFDFHPLRLVSGNYLQPDDVMDDRVLLDEETAWLLFGGMDLAGMSFAIEGKPFVVAGVYKHDADSFSRRAEGDAMCIYMNYDAFERMFPEKTGISCYELVMADPVRGFALTAAGEKFTAKDAEIVDNSARFSVARLWALLKDRRARVMRTGFAVYPAWENAARAAEDRAAQLFALACVLAVLPAVLMLLWLGRLTLHGREKLREEILPDARERVEEAVRVRSRRRWERRHPEEK